MKEYWFEELGFFTEPIVKQIKKVMDRRTFMKFEVCYSNMHGNYTLGVKTNDDATEEDIKCFFLNAALTILADLTY